MARGINEVEAAVNSVVDDVSPVQPTLILEVPLKLVIYVADHWLEAEKTMTTLNVVHMYDQGERKREKEKKKNN